MSVQGIYYMHCIGHGACPNLTTEIPQQCLLCCFKILVNIGQGFALFLGGFIVAFEYCLFIVNVIKCYLMHIFLEHQIGIIFMEVVAKR